MIPRPIVGLAAARGRSPRQAEAAIAVMRTPACVAASCLPLLALAPGALADPADGIAWSTVTAPGNPAYQRPGGGYSINNGRGSVGYAYRMATMEVSTGQWMEFANAMAGTPEAEDLTFGLRWGAGWRDGRYELREMDRAALVPVIGMTWRSAARYCNWLHNGGGTDPAAMRARRCGWPCTSQ